jgi:hypothetical protein
VLGAAITLRAGRGRALAAQRPSDRLPLGGGALVFYRPEPAYELLNARIICTPRCAKWQLSEFGTNFTNEWCANGGFDLGYAWGYGPATIGRSREVGVDVRFVFD